MGIQPAVPSTFIPIKHGSSSKIFCRRLAVIDRRSISPKTRSLVNGSKPIRRLASRLDLPDSVAREAIGIFRIALNGDLVRSRTVEGIAAAAVFIAGKRGDYGLVLKDLTGQTDVSIKETCKCIRTLQMWLKPEKRRRDIAILIGRLGTELGVTMYTQQEAHSLLRRAEVQHVTMGKRPMTSAAICLYIAGMRTGERRTQVEVARTAKTTPVTIRQRSNELIEALELNVERKRGAGAKSIIIEDYAVFTRQKAIAGP
jgi:transcription initiation factor TFIIB